MAKPFLLALSMIAVALAVSAQAPRQPVVERPAAASPDPIPPKLEAVAETKLLMEGMAKPNVEGLAKLLKDKPVQAESWTFARGQALLIAETGNLLMLRPPKAKAAQEAWLARSAEMRDAASKLAKAAAAKDYLSARASLARVANSCNRCHESFRIPTRIVPFE